MANASLKKRCWDSFSLFLSLEPRPQQNLIGNAILCFTEHPAQLTRLRQTPALFPLAIEEVLRYRSPVQWMLRFTARDVEIGVHSIPAGKRILIMIGSANRDPKHFADPSHFDIARDPNPHLAFGHGIHFCICAPLSRLESRWRSRSFSTALRPFNLPAGGHGRHARLCTPMARLARE